MRYANHNISPERDKRVVVDKRDQPWGKLERLGQSGPENTRARTSGLSPAGNESRTACLLSSLRAEIGKTSNQHLQVYMERFHFLGICKPTVITDYSAWLSQGYSRIEGCYKNTLLYVKVVSYITLWNLQCNCACKKKKRIILKCHYSKKQEVFIRLIFTIWSS